MTSHDDAVSDELRARAANHARVLVDLGTGDGRFAYRCAKADPDQFVVGVDAHAEGMREIAAKAAKKPSKGGLPNVQFLTAALPELPEWCTGLADRITIVMPWGNLLAGLVVPEPAMLACIRRVLRPHGVAHIVLNGEVWHDAGSIEHLTLPAPTIEHIDATLVDAYGAAGLCIDERRALVSDEIARLRSSWVRRLAAGRDQPRFVYVRALAP